MPQNGDLCVRQQSTRWAITARFFSSAARTAANETKSPLVTLELGVSHSRCGGTEGDSCLCFPVCFSCLCTSLASDASCFCCVVHSCGSQVRNSCRRDATPMLCRLHPAHYCAANHARHHHMRHCPGRLSRPASHHRHVTAQQWRAEFNCLLLTEGHRAVAQHQQVWKYEFRK